MTEEEIRLLMETDPAQGERALFDAYYTYVYAIALRRISGNGTREDAEECVVDVFLEVIRHFGSVRSGSLRAYIGAVARNKAINLSRHITAKAQNTVSLDDERIGERLSSAQNVEAAVEQSDLADRLLDAIEALGEPDATILIQKFYYDRNAAQIGRLLHMKPSSVRSRCARALRRLQKALADSM